MLVLLGPRPLPQVYDSLDLQHQPLPDCTQSCVVKYLQACRARLVGMLADVDILDLVMKSRET